MANKFHWFQDFSLGGWRTEAPDGGILRVEKDFPGWISTRIEPAGSRIKGRGETREESAHNLLEREHHTKRLAAA